MARSARTLLALCCAALALPAVAGPIDPPAGPVTGTFKTLTEVEPRTAINITNTPGDADSLFKITQRGSYYLTGNITGVANKHGIEIAANGVTLDLNGFDLSGIPAMGAFDGVSATVIGLRNIAVVNGSVRSWGGDGVDLASFGAINCRVEDVLASGNTGSGINAGGGSTVSNCSAFLNSGNGMYVGDGSTITNCSVTSTTGNGISTGGGCVVSHCSANNNTGSGINAGSGCTVVDCTTHQNALDGIQCFVGCVIRGNTCFGNGLGEGIGAGIHATSNDNRIEGNNCTSADRGIVVDLSGNIIIKNTCSGNTTNWVIAASNYYGPIIDRTGIVTAAVNGPAAAGTLATTDPNANFSY